MVKVAVLGAAGGIGQPLSLLMTQNPHVTHLSLYDVVNVNGVAADLSHINRKCKVTGHSKEFLKECLVDCQVVIIPAGVPRKPGMTRDDLFKINASIVRDLATAAAQHCPKACLLIISNPVNSTVPIACEIFKKHGCFDPKKIMGVTSLDIVRACRFLHEIRNEMDPEKTCIQVIGGHSGPTIIPLFSQTCSNAKLTQQEIEALTNRVQYGGDEVVKAKDGAGSATLSMAHAGALFAGSILNALTGTESQACAYVNLDCDPTNGAAIRKETGCDYFATKITFGKEGVSKIEPFKNLSDYEKKLLADGIAALKPNIATGVEFAKL